MLIALGGADGVWAEFEQARALCPDADVGAVNNAGIDYRGHLTLWATLHPERFQKWQEGRHGNTDYIAASHRHHRGTRVDLVVEQTWSGASGLFLCQVAAMSLGYDRIIVCGMPMDKSPHYFGGDNWQQARKYRSAWERAVQHMNIRSMSGWTRELVGPPDNDWVKYESNQQNVRCN